MSPKKERFDRRTTLKGSVWIEPLERESFTIFVLLHLISIVSLLHPRWEAVRPSAARCRPHRSMSGRGRSIRRMRRAPSPARAPFPTVLSSPQPATNNSSVYFRATPYHTHFFYNLQNIITPGPPPKAKKNNNWYFKKSEVFVWKIVVLCLFFRRFDASLCILRPMVDL